MRTIEILTVVATWFLFLKTSDGQKLGESCLTEKGQNGTCRLLSNCQLVKDNVHKGNFPSDWCGFQRTDIIVCCPMPFEIPDNIKDSSARTLMTLSSKIPVLRNVGDKANAMCKFYAEYAYIKIVSLISQYIFSDVPDCVGASIPLIVSVGGTAAQEKEFPHMVQIGFREGMQISWDCCGSLISENYVLTAAHCLTKGGRINATVVRGGLTKQSELDHLQIRNILERIKYPDYVSEKYHDIGLIKVEKNFDFNSYLKPACIFLEKNIPFKRAIATGWGFESADSTSGSENLIEVDLELFTTAECNQTYRKEINLEHSKLAQGIVEDFMICAGSHKGRKDTCYGDSGGPLQIIHKETKDNKCMYEIIGITSFGVPCGLAPNTPGVYTRVFHYIKWIEDTVWP